VINWGIANLVAINAKIWLIKMLNAVNLCLSLFEPHKPHVIFVKYEIYLCLFIFINPGWVTDYGSYDNFLEDY
jgi:hypothetical protein